MADINVQMPSEHEDFDAKSDGMAPATTETPTEAAPAPAASTETPDFSKPEEAAPAPAAEAAAPEVTTSEEAAPAAPEVTASEEAAPAPVAVKEPKVRKPLPVWQLATALLALAVIGLGFYSFTLMGAKNDIQAKLDKANANPQLLVQKQTDDLIAAVGKLMTLPAGETPTVANVSDAAKAKQQSAFFANAQNGDRVLMYVKAGEAILYRPSTNKIILVAPLTFNNTATK